MKENTMPLRMRTKGHYDPENPFQVELDIMKEKAEALGRTGGRLDESMGSLDKRITMLKREGKGAREVNALMREFNEIRKRALQYLHHLIIHMRVSRPLKKDFFRKTMYEVNQHL
jgi:hypothetical protein